MRNQYEEQLRQLNESLTEMGDLCEAAIGKVNEALKAGHQAVVSEIYDLEMEVAAARGKGSEADLLSP